MVPQVNSAAMAEKLAGKMRYGPEGRGFSPSTPGAAYGTRGIADHLARQPGETVLVCQIEDEGAVAEAQEIAAVDGVDALLVGPVDLAVSMGMTDTSNPDVMAKCRQAIAPPVRLQACSCPTPKRHAHGPRPGAICLFWAPIRHSSCRPVALFWVMREPHSKPGLDEPINRKDFRPYGMDECLNH